MTNTVPPTNNRNATTPPHPATDMGPPVRTAPQVQPMGQVAHNPQPPPVLDAHSYHGVPQPHATTPPHPATDMGPPVLSAPQVQPMGQVTHNPQPPPVLDAHSYRGVPQPQNNGRIVTPDVYAPPSSAHVGPPGDYMPPAFVSPTKGAACLPQPSMEDPMFYRPVMGTQGYPSPYSYERPGYVTAHAGPLTDLYPSYPLPEHLMAVDGSYYPRIPTPHTPARVNSRHSTPNLSPQAYTGVLVTPPRQTSRLPAYRNVHTPLRTAAECNTALAQYLGGIPGNQLSYPPVPFSATGSTKRGYNDLEDGEFYGNEHEEFDDASLNIRFMPLLGSLSFFSLTLTHTLQGERSELLTWAQQLKNAGTILRSNRSCSTSHSAAKMSAPMS